MATLKPCPKCGKRKFAFVNDEDGWIFCRNCGYSTQIYETMHEAIEEWNGLSEQSTVDSEQGEGNGCGY